MRDLRRIRKYLTPEVAVLAINALVSSRLDYCNSLFRGLSGFNQYKLQSIQNTLACIVTNHGKYAHVTPILQKLHWLPVRYRCIYKTATLVYQKISSHFPVSILDSLLHPVDSVRNLGVWFDADFSFSEHIKRTCKACFLEMRDLRRIRKYLTPEVAVLAINALVSSRLDYCNSLFRGLSGFNQYKLQSIQNTLARIVTNHGKYAHVTPILQKLHWLPVRYRCIYKTATLVYKFLDSGSPSYFEPFLSFSSCPYSTRHSHPDCQYLTVPPFHSSVFKSAKHFVHSFAFDAPKIWNDVPQDVRGATSVASFRKKLKTYLFAKAYPP